MSRFWYIGYIKLKGVCFINDFYLDVMFLLWIFCEVVVSLVVC